MAIPIDDFVAAHHQAASLYEDYQAAVTYYDETGEWAGERYKVGRVGGKRTLEGNKSPKNIPKETFDARELEAPGYKKMIREMMDETLATLKRDSVTAGFRLERKRIRIDQGTVDVEDFSQEEWNRLVARSIEIRTKGTEANKQFISLVSDSSDMVAKIPGTEDRLVYAMHSGSPELEGGILKGSKTVGSDKNVGGVVLPNDTNAQNLRTMQDVDKEIEDIKKYLQAKESPSELKKLSELEKFYSIAGPQGSYVTGSYASNPVQSLPYLGRTDWGNFGQKSVEEVGSLAESTGGRGTAYLVAGAYGVNVRSVRGEVAITGDVKPIAGLSQKTHELFEDSRGNMSYRPTVRGSEMPDGSHRAVIDIWHAWAEEQMIKHRAAVLSGEVPPADIYGTTGAKVLGLTTGEEATVAARVSSRAVAETVEEGVEKAVRHSGATGRLLGAATEASAAVAGGINSAGALRNIGTALTVLRGRL